MNKFIMSYSCGKDSTLALYRMIKLGYIPAALLITVNKIENMSWFHGISKDLMEKVSKSLNIPLILVETEGSNYENMFTESLIRAKKELGINFCVFGDIDLEDHRKWCTDRCDEAKIEAVFPLWNENREKLVYEFIDLGFKAVIKKVNNKYMGEEFLGKLLTKEVVIDIKETGSDPCGENGEYHTFVYDGPIFTHPIKFENLNILKSNNSSFLDIRGV